MNHLIQLPYIVAKTVLTSQTRLPMSVGQIALAPSDYPATVLDPSGQDLCEVILCKNTSGGTLAKGILLVRDSAEEPLGYGVKAAPTSQHPATVVGVVPENLVDESGAAVTAVADNDYFFAIRKGNVKVLTDASGATIDLGLIVDGSTAGNGANATATGAACGFWLATGSAALVLARINATG
jgi:hypothetical protein